MGISIGYCMSRDGNNSYFDGIALGSDAIRSITNMATCNVVLLPSKSIKVEPDFEEESDVSFSSPVNSPENSQTRFGDTSEEEIQRILEDKNRPNTKKATKTAVNVLREYLKEKELETNFEDFDKSFLNNVLRKFYVEVRKRDGDFYKKSALNSIRFALNRYLQTTRKIDIINDPDFRLSDEVFRAQSVELVRLGKGSVDHVNDMSVEDIKKLYFSDVLNINTPEGLLRKVFFDLMYLSGSKRSRGTLREQTKQTFAIAEDHYTKFIFLNKDALGLQNFSWRIYEKKGRFYLLFIFTLGKSRDQISDERQFLTVLTELASSMSLDFLFPNLAKFLVKHYNLISQKKLGYTKILFKSVPNIFIIKLFFDDFYA